MKSHLLTWLTISCLTVSMLTPAIAQVAGEAKSLAAVVADHPPTVDGSLNDDAWRQAPLIPQFHQLNPVEFGRPFERTEVRVLFDADNLYIAVKLYYDDISDLTAQGMVPAGRISTDDRFSIVLDPFLDRRNGYYFG